MSRECELEKRAIKSIYIPCIEAGSSFIWFKWVYMIRHQGMVPTGIAHSVFLNPVLGVLGGYGFMTIIMIIIEHFCIPMQKSGLSGVGSW